MNRVLVVEDDPEIREIVATKLELNGVEVLQAENGVDGLEVALRELPDLVILDLSMPRMNGIDLSRAIRADTKTASTPIIMLTARGQEADIERGFEAGASDYMVKPVSPRELMVRVNRLLAASP